jgi:hypothetical protein
MTTSATSLNELLQVSYTLPSQAVLMLLASTAQTSLEKGGPQVDSGIGGRGCQQGFRIPGKVGHSGEVTMASSSILCKVLNQIMLGLVL